MSRPLGRALAALALVVFGVPSVASAQGAWTIKHQWSDKARPGDPTSGSFGYEYAAASVADAGSMTKAGVAYDCADFAITVLVDYAARNGLPLTFTLGDPAKNFATGPVSSTDKRFTSADQFAKFARDYLNAKGVALNNTSPISYDEWRAGDLVLLSWKQLGDQNPFYPRDVWHTYFVGDPGKLLFYGDENGSDPAPISASEEQSRIDNVYGRGPLGGAVYGASPRRWNVLKDSIVPPDVALTNVPPVDAPEQATVKVSGLNVRTLPSTQGTVLKVARSGDTFRVEGTAPGGWLRVRDASGSVAYVKADYVSTKTVSPDYTIARDTPVDEAPNDGIVQALGGVGN